MLKNLTLITFLLLTGIVLAQPGTAPIKEVNGKKYYVHKVQPGNTLWGLQQMYGVKVEEIVAENPELREGLKADSEVLIPVKGGAVAVEEETTSKYKVKRGETLYGLSRKFNTTVDKLIELNPPLASEGLKKGEWIIVPGKIDGETEEVVNADPEVEPLPNPFVVDTVVTDTHHEEVKIKFSDTTIRHTVLPHETMYSISKRFMVKIDKIMELNNLNSTALSEGQVLIIPVKQERIEKVKIKEVQPDYDPNSNDPISFEVKDRYRIAVMIPLHLDYGPGYSEYVSKLATQYYMGTSMAIDSLKTMGLNADVMFFDTRNDSAAVEALLRKPEFNDLDLIIGPFFPQNQRIVAKFCKENKVRMVCPVNSDSGILEDNRLVYASVPSNITLMRGLAKHMLIHNAKDNIVLVKPTKKSDMPLYEAFRDAFMESPVEGSRPALKECTTESLKYQIQRGVNTIFVVPTADNSTAGKFMTTLTRSEFRSKPEDLFVYGTKEWINFTDINGSYKNNYNLHIPSPNYLDYYTDEMIELNKRHRELYKTDLSRMAVQGYDVMMHFCSDFFLNKDVFLMMNDIEMTQVSERDGWENTKVFVLEQEEYELINTEHKDD